MQSSHRVTASGVPFDVMNPEPHKILIVDIAHGLSHICRFCGATPVFYSVAQHSIIVSEILWREKKDKQLALAGLLHDASEAYMGDVPRGLKPKEFAKAEHELLKVIANKFLDNEPDLMFDPAVKIADQAALRLEKEHFWPNVEWWPISSLPEPPRIRILPGPPRMVKNHFIALWQELSG